MLVEVWTLLRKNISKAQLVGYAVANIVGLAVVLSGVLFYCDSQHTKQTDDTYFSSDYIVISKKVEGVGFTPSIFTQEEIDDITAQPWTNRVGQFTSSQFAVSASVDVGGKGLASYLFFESVPDDYFDIKPKGWDFDPKDRFVPIIVNKDYLSLYNFGFAAPQGLPQVSEGMIGMVPIKLYLYGPSGYPERFDASIVGFSSRLNTIAVPQGFMDWANAHFAPGSVSQPSRLILEIDRLKSAGMEEFLASKGYEIGGDKSDTSQVSSFLATVSGVVAVIGVVICALALFILVLSILLMLQKSRRTLSTLMGLGYSPSVIGRYYKSIVVVVNCVVAALAVTVALLARGAWTSSLDNIGLGGASVLPMLGIAVAYLAVSLIIDFAIIRRHLLLIWQKP